MRVVTILVIVPIAAATDTGPIDRPELVTAVSPNLCDDPPVTYPG